MAGCGERDGHLTDIRLAKPKSERNATDEKRAPSNLTSRGENFN
jgi:hypothetical protein